MTTQAFIRRLAFSTAALLLHTASHAVVHSNDASGFSIDINPPWIAPPAKELRAESTVRCAPSACGHNVLLTFSAYYEPSLKKGKISQFLKHTNGKTLTQDLQSSKARFTIVAEGRTRVGKLDGYEVIADVTQRDGNRYLRHAFTTFNAGTIYTILLVSPVNAHDKALAAAKPLIDSFSLK